jgi:hypothetical protein
MSLQSTPTLSYLASTLILVLTPHVQLWLHYPPLVYALAMTMTLCSSFMDPVLDSLEHAVMHTCKSATSRLPNKQFAFLVVTLVMLNNAL